MSTKSRRAILSLAIVAVSAAFFGAYSFLPLSAPHRAASPDENANGYFAGRFADEGQLWYFDSLNMSAPGLIHPRSVRVVDDFLVPGGFLGLPVLYGGIVKGLGKAALPYLTPFFAVLGVAAWGLLVARFFGRATGIIASLLLAAHPAWWYESARTLQPNVFFMALALLSAWFLLAEPIGRALRDRDGLLLLRNADAVIAGILCAFALAVRTSEAYWFAIIALVLLAFAFPRLPWKRLALFTTGFSLAFIPFLYLNESVYGALFATGYGTGIDVPVASVPQGRGAALLGPAAKYLFPLGFAPRDALRHFASYGINFFWWWSVLVAASALALAFEARRIRLAKLRIPRNALVFAAISLVVGSWLMLFYGSWTVQDNPDPTAVTIGSSYIRYWLPVFVFSTLPVAWLVARAASMMRPLRRHAFLAAFALLFLLSAASDVFLSPQEGLLALRKTLIADDAAARMIFAKTEPKALVIVDRADKFVFPERRVMYPLRSDETYAAFAKLKEMTTIYYFGITFPEDDLRWLRETKLPPLGLTIDPVETAGDETLYRFRKL